MSQRSIWDEIVFGIRNDALEDEVSQAALRAYRCGVDDKEIEDIIRGKVHHARIQQELGLATPFKIPRLRKGDLVLGLDDRKKPVVVQRPWLNAGMFIGANTGGGKTTLQHFLFLQLAANQYPNLWMSDMYKAGHRHLRPLLERFGQQLVVATPSRMRLNLLQPDGEPRAHLSMAVDILARVLQLPPRAIAIIRMVGNKLYEDFGLYEGRRGRYPVLYDLYQAVMETPGINTQAQEAILDRLGALLISLTPAIAAWRLAWRPRDLTAHHIAWEFRGLSEPGKLALLSYLLFSVLHFRLEEGVNNAPLNLMVAFDDCQRFFSTADSSVSDLPPLDEVAGLIRGTGTSLCGAAQTMTGLSKGLLPNLATKIMGRLGGHRDYQALGADMGLTAEQTSWAKLNLGPGRFIAQIAEGPWRHPFILNIPRMTIPQNVTDQDALQSISCLDSLPTIPAQEYSAWQPRQSLKVQIPKKAEKSCSGLTLSEAEFRFIDSIIKYPNEPCSAYAKYCGMSSKKAIAVRKGLVSAGLIQERPLQRAARGRARIILLVTQEALEAIKAWQSSRQA